MENLGYYNGKIGRIEEMMVPMTDRALYFGDGVYDAAICKNNIAYRLSEHIRRFFDNCARLRMRLSMSREDLTVLLNGLIRRVDADEKFLYWQISRGSGIRAHDFPDTDTGNLLITVTPFSIGDITRRVSLCTMRDIRYGMCDMKTLNLLPGVLAAQRARESGCEETVFYRSESEVTECSHSNLSILKDGVLYTHPADCRILAGVARADLIRACGSLNIPVREEIFSLTRLAEADEILVTSSTKFCLAANRLDGKAVGGRAPFLVEELQALLWEDFRREVGFV